MNPMKFPKLHVAAIGRKRSAFQAALHDFLWNFNRWVKFSIRPAEFYDGLKLIAVHWKNLLQK
jgi:hypothetical protein